MEAESLSIVAVDGGRIVYRRIGKGRPLVVLNGFGATSADWDPSFIDRLASSNELILLNNRGIGGSTDDGQSFNIEKLADGYRTQKRESRYRARQCDGMVDGLIYRTGLRGEVC